MNFLTIVWILLAVVFVIAISKGFRQGYKKGAKKTFGDLGKSKD